MANQIEPEGDPLFEQAFSGGDPVFEQAYSQGDPLFDKAYGGGESSDKDWFKNLVRAEVNRTSGPTDNPIFQRAVLPGLDYVLGAGNRALYGSLAKGPWEGLKHTVAPGGEHSSLSEFLGWEKDTLPKKVAAFGVDVIGDPLTWVGGLGLINKLAQLQKVQNVTHKIAASPFGKLTFQRAPQAFEKSYSLEREAAERGHNTRLLEANPLKEALDRELAASKMDPEQLDALWQSKQIFDLPPQYDPLVEATVNYMGMDAALARQLAERQASVGMKESLRREDPFSFYSPRVGTYLHPKRAEEEAQAILEGRFDPRTSRVALDVGEAEKGRRVPLLDPETKQPIIKNLQDWEDVAAPGGKMGNPLDELKTALHEGKPVALGDPYTEEMYRAGVVPEGSFVPGLPLSNLANITAKSRKIADIDLLTSGLEQGWALPKGAYGPTLSGMPARGIKAKGWGDFEIDPAVANLFENRVNPSYYGEGLAGGLGNLLERFSGSRGGQAATRFGQHFKNLSLPLFPTYHEYNLLSNLPQRYLAGESSWRLPGNTVSGFKKMTPEMENELAIRGVTSGGFSGSEAMTDLAKAVRGPGYVESAAEKLGVEGPVSRVLHGNPEGKTWVTKTGLEDVPEAGWKAGGWIENASRRAAFKDYLRRNKTDLTTLSPEERAAFLDKAGYHSKRALVDYDLLTPFERRVKELGVPFLSWYSGYGRQMAHLLKDDPARLARFNHFLQDVMLTPPPKLATDFMPAGQVEQVPTTQLFGQDLGTDDQGNPNMLLAQRALPMGFGEQAFNRPDAFLASILYPWLREGIQNPRNFNIQAGRPIDRVTKATEEIPTKMDALYSGRKLFGVGFDPRLESLLMNTALAPYSRLANTADWAGRAAGLWEDPYRPMTTVGQALRGEGEMSSIGEYAAPSRFYGMDLRRMKKLGEAKYREAGRELSGQLKNARRVGDQDMIEDLRGKIRRLNRDSRRLGFQSALED